MMRGYASWGRYGGCDAGTARGFASQQSIEPEPRDESRADVILLASSHKTPSLPYNL